jgi:hypothetical protein
MVDENFFRDAGQELRNELIVDNANRDQALAALDALPGFCETGISEFFDGGKHDLRIQHFGEHLSVHYLTRVNKNGHSVSGPTALIVVAPDGTMSWAAGTTWRPKGEQGPALVATPIDVADYEQQVAERLTEFLAESERQYRGQNAG